MLVACLAAFVQWPTLRLPGIFGDHMVLQRERAVAVWGQAYPGDRIEIEASWGMKSNAIADAQGAWKTQLLTGHAGGPYTVNFKSGHGSKKLEDVMLGEVWLCGGQSNMEWPVGDIGYNPPIENSAAEVAAANLPNLRLITIPRAGAEQPQSDVVATWSVCTPATVQNFSATGYMFGSTIQKKLGVPVGLISSNVGGTEVELWMSEGSIKASPALAGSLARRAEQSKSYESAMKEYVARRAALAGPEDPAQERWEDSDWTPLASADKWSKVPDLARFDGYVWYRAEFELAPDVPHTDGLLKLGTIDDEDETFVNGLRVGDLHVWNADRNYRLGSRLFHTGRNVVAIRVLDSMGEGGFDPVAPKVVEVGGKTIPLAKWRYKIVASTATLGAPPSQPNRGSSLYNAMIAPLAPFAIRGAIWYQGEANVGRGFQYRETFPAMIADWRRTFGQGDFPFYYVQIAPFSGYGPGDEAADLRESQLVSLRTKNTGMAVVTDLVPDPGNIHPPMKRPVGERLARWAFAKTYGIRGIVVSGPQYRSMKVEGAKVRLSFDYADGLALRNGGAEFSIAGPDRKFVSAQARVEGKSLVVWSDAVSAPASVRFGWSSAPKANLFNGEGLPASPFRTDDWPATTAKAGW